MLQCFVTPRINDRDGESLVVVSFYPTEHSIFNGSSGSRKVPTTVLLPHVLVNLLC